MITKQLEILQIQDNETLGIWWCQLNMFQWPNELPDPEPPSQWRKGIRGEIMDWIVNKITHKECLRIWNAKHMSREEFNAWFDNLHSEYS